MLAFLFVKQPVRCDLNLSWLYTVVLRSCPYASDVIKTMAYTRFIGERAAKII